MPSILVDTAEILSKVVSYLPDHHDITAERAGGKWQLTYPEPLQPLIDTALAASNAFVPVPETVSMAQARSALTLSNMIGSVDAAIRAGNTTPQGKINEVFWEYSTTVDRASPFVNGLGSALGLSSDQLDDLFRQAASIKI
jgi:hypothetical protein